MEATDSDLEHDLAMLRMMAEANQGVAFVLDGAATHPAVAKMILRIWDKLRYVVAIPPLDQEQK